MTAIVGDSGGFDLLEARLKTLLPGEYQDSYEDVQPVSMGSAGLIFGLDGKVAWNDMWQTFCDLAMAGGPPHKGTLLEPASKADIDARPAEYDAVVEEICRGIRLVTGLDVQASANRGWVRVTCDDATMAGWLLRAIVMENVSARSVGRTLELPAGPHYRVEKEIKNVITVTAKTCHYWQDHMWLDQQHAIGRMFDSMQQASPLIVPAEVDNHASWRGVECGSVRAAVWMMRMIVAGNVLARREGTTVFVPVNPTQDPDGVRVSSLVSQVQQLALARGAA